MNEVNNHKVFAGMFLGVFVAAMWVITGGVMDIAAAVSAPVILTATAIVFAMLYATTYHSDNHENPPTVDVMKAAAQKISPAKTSHLKA